MRRSALIGVLVGLVVSLAPASLARGNTLTPMCTVGSSQAQPCVGSWYTSAVTVVWQASPPPVSTTGCQLGIEYPFTADSVSTLSCSASWSDGSSSSYSLPLHVETSFPAATANPSRPPDSGDWYNHPVTAAVTATSFSGIVSCTPATYAGPSSLGALVFGTCLDNAGKTVTVASTPFAYDTTPPSLTVSAAPGDRSVVLSWQTSGDIAPTASVIITRGPAGGLAAPVQTVYSGTASGFRDISPRNGVPYRYTITAIDQAGNASVQAITVIPGPRLLAPAPNAHLTSAPLLSWTPILGATYYNVQLYRGHGNKVLSVWPNHASLQLRGIWRFNGRRYRLKPGRYRWYVWPGFGRRSAARYGRIVGSGAFVVVR